MDLRWVPGVMVPAPGVLPSASPTPADPERDVGDINQGRLRSRTPCYRHVLVSHSPRRPSRRCIKSELGVVSRTFDYHMGGE